MTIDEFAAITGERIPTPAEFVRFTTGQGWRIVTNGEAASLRAPASDPLAVALAKMLGREPYRTNVLRYVADHANPDPTGEPREDTVTTDPKVPAPRETGPTVPETPRYCPMCAALVLAVPATVTEAFCENPLCHYRGRTGSTNSRGSRAT